MLVPHFFEGPESITPPNWAASTREVVLGWTGAQGHVVRITAASRGEMPRF